jgi:phospholipid/cholesterol/gamma-HCH transport system ATP-binding protein
MVATTDNIIEVQNLKNYIGNQWVHRDINLSIKRGEIIAIIGGSGTGKTTLLRCIVMLAKPTGGNIWLFGNNIKELNDNKINAIKKRWGMMFQHNALFSSMTVLENIMFPMKEFTDLPQWMMQDLAYSKLELVGLPINAAHKYPNELSGGMPRRAAAARAIALEPELLFLDEPTTGLDPKSARKFDECVLFLRNTLKLTIIFVSHDLESIRAITDRIAFIGDGKILAVEPYEKLIKNPHKLIADYFSKF